MSKSGKVGSTKTQATKVTVKTPNVPKITSKAPSAPKIARIPASSSIKVRVAPTPKTVRPVGSAIISRSTNKATSIGPVRGKSGAGTVSHSRIASHLGQKKTLATANQVSRSLLTSYFNRRKMEGVRGRGAVFEQRVATHLRQKKRYAVQHSQITAQTRSGQKVRMDHVVGKDLSRLQGWEDKNSELNRIKLDTAKQYVRQAARYRGARIISPNKPIHSHRISGNPILAFPKQPITPEVQTKLDALMSYAKDRKVSINFVP